MARLLIATATLAFFLFLVIPSHALSSPQEEYWHSVLPNTPMPNAIRDVLNSDPKRVNTAGVVVDGLPFSYNGGLTQVQGLPFSYNGGKAKPDGLPFSYNGGDNAQPDGLPFSYNGGAAHTEGLPFSYNGGDDAHHVDGLPFSYNGEKTAHTEGLPFSYNGGAAHTEGLPFSYNGGTAQTEGLPFSYNGGAARTEGLPFSYNGGTAHTDGLPFSYNGGARQSYEPSVTTFFQEKELKPGTKMNLVFKRTSYRVAFLSRPDAESIPFSTTRLPQILSRFSVDPKSALAKSIVQTLTVCEQPAVVGERKLCATSLESMVDFSTSSLGTNKVEAVSTTVVGKEEEKVKKPQLFAVAPNGIRQLPGDRVVSCHEVAYPYAVFYCHAAPSRGYVVELVGEDGTKVEAAATCHTDTKAWNPNHMAFKELKVKPGTVPICHFLPQDSLIWSRSN